jgi:ABC-type polysaccharide/polyol phosphate transport system ATPase subunit
MSCDDVVISVRNLGKTYRLFGHPGDRLKQAMSFGLRTYHKEYTALARVSFEVKGGEAVGIIGRNGSGKSTLLQLICGILTPTSGSVEVKGRVSALLELGAGFNPEFTGRENVYFQGALMGVGRDEMEGRLEEIAEFADIGKFIDQPVRTYSSGMFVRLAFAVLIHVDSDILVIDEALAVGDEAFQKKCFEKLAAFLDSEEKVLFFVSHNIRQVQRLCERSIWISHGRVAQDGDSGRVCAAYVDDINTEICVHDGSRVLRPNVADSGEIKVTRLVITSGDSDQGTNAVDFHGRLGVTVVFKCEKELRTPEIIVGLQTADGVFISAASTATLSNPPSFSQGEHVIRCSVPELTLLPGAYQIRIAFLDRHRRAVWVGHMLHAFRVQAAEGHGFVSSPHGLVDMPFEWDFQLGG